MGLVMDSSALISWERGTGTLPMGLSLDERLVVPAIVWAEAMVGVRLADTPERAASRQRRLTSLRQLLGIQPFTQEVAESYAEIYSTLVKSGHMIPSNDINVAATARYLGFGVLVGPKDEAHFRAVEGLPVQVLIPDWALLGH